MQSNNTIAIIGAGNVGRALGATLAKTGKTIVYGVRNAEAAAESIAHIPGATATDAKVAAQSSDMIFLTVPAAVAPALVPTLGPVQGKVLVDCSNPVSWDQGPVWSPPTEGSVAQAIKKACPDALVVKALNTFGAEFHGAPTYEGPAGEESVDVPMAGDEAAKARLTEVLTTAGFAPVDAGPLRNASVLENHAILWIHLATVGGQGRSFVFNRRARVAN